MSGKRHAFICSMVLTAFLAGCGGGESSEQVASQIKYPLKFPHVSVPSMMSGDKAGLYMVEHCWDAFLDSSRHFRCDSTLISGVDAAEVEAVVSNYVAGLRSLELDKSCEIIRKFAGSLIACERADSSSNVFEAIGACFERYVFDPNSPLRDEDLYAPYAKVMSECGLVPDGKRQVYASDAALCMLNRRGTKAADFSFADKNGRRGSLYGTQARYTLVFFSNPGCHACKEIIDALSMPGPVSDMVTAGVLAVINIYIDEELDEWYEYMPIYPQTWHNVYDDNYVIRGEELYNIRAIPSLYLLDADKTVMLKDAPPEALYQTLENIIRNSINP